MHRNLEALAARNAKDLDDAHERISHMLQGVPAHMSRRALALQLMRAGARLLHDEVGENATRRMLERVAREGR